MASELAVGLGFLAQYQGTKLMPWQIPSLAAAMIVAAWIGWVAAPNRRIKGKRKALERKSQPTKKVISISGLACPEMVPAI